ncbi:glycosyltransferase family 2 protein [Roseivirga sp.]|uniref:glycosyltransferase family 2 protein n=1 Tax=Roseivirga sp. TaxID=1964215 RepID=UPI003B8C75B4
MSKEETLVSLIMPIKNLGHYVSETIESASSQTYENWELIIINDHSTDNTAQIALDLAQREERIKLVENESKGIIPALQKGLAVAKGQYISRIDGDDIMPKERLQLMVEALAGSEPKTVVTGKVKYFGTPPISEGYTKYEHWLNNRIDLKDHWQWVYRECVIASPNWMVRKSELKAIGEFTDLQYPEDYDLVLKWYRQGFQVKSIPKTTLLWREHAARTSRNSTNYQQETFFRLKIRHFVKHELKDSQLIVWGTDKKGKLAKQLLDELGIPFSWMGLSIPNESHKVLNQKVFDYRAVENENNFKLLITVFPNAHQRAALEDYLSDLNLQHGKCYFYL